MMNCFQQQYRSKKSQIRASTERRSPAIKQRNSPIACVWSNIVRPCQCVIKLVLLWRDTWCYLYLAWILPVKRDGIKQFVNSHCVANVTVSWVTNEVKWYGAVLDLLCPENWLSDHLIESYARSRSVVKTSFPFLALGTKPSRKSRVAGVVMRHVSHDFSNQVFWVCDDDSIWSALFLSPLIHCHDQLMIVAKDTAEPPALIVSRQWFAVRICINQRCCRWLLICLRGGAWRVGSRWRIGFVDFCLSNIEKTLATRKALHPSRLQVTWHWKILNISYWTEK